ncbi:MAG: RNA-binding domain-containing protein [Christensenellales bacterium]|jgi:ATP-dependent DNA helicase RecG
MNFGFEDETLEFKKTTGEINEALKSICAMLNKHGMGTVYFGILASGEVKGQMVNEATLRDVSRKVFESIVPQIVPNVTKKIVDEKEIIEVTFKGNDRPYSCKGIYYIRVADEDRILPPHELRQLFEYNKAGSWDAELTTYTINDIDIETLKRFYDKAIACGRLKDESFDVTRLLTKLELIREEKLTNAGYLLFSKNKPIVLKMAVFATDEKLTFLDINRLSGNMYKLINEANSYVTKNIRWKADIIGLERMETPEVPLKALREIICNSFAHARYNTMTEHEISIHPSFIRIYNPGEFPIGYKPEDFIHENIPSMVRNPLILKTLFLSADVESYSSGFKRVYEECGKNNVDIDYEIRREGFTFIFKRNSTKHQTKDTKINDLTKDEKLTLYLLADNPSMSAMEISKVINKSHRTVQRILSKLQSRGAIERVGSTRGYWEIIYS